jgi:hypothetical protein
VKITTKKTRVSFGFTSEPGATFKCKLDSGSAKACTSPKSYSVGVGKHTFKVTATDTNANVGPPARYTFKVVRK